MHIIDSHFHWWPRSVFEKLCTRKDYPRARVNTNGGYDYWRRAGAGAHLNSWADWFDLDEQFVHMDGLGHRVDVVCSIGPFSVAFSDMPASEGRGARSVSSFARSPPESARADIDLYVQLNAPGEAHHLVDFVATQIEPRRS